MLAKREADAKWPRVRPPIIETKQHVTRYTQSATDEPFYGFLGFPCQLITLSGVLKVLVARHLTDLFFRLTDKVLALVLGLVKNSRVGSFL